MIEKPSRREALKSIGSASVVALLDAQSLPAQESAIRVAGQPVEISVSQVSPVTVRLSVTTARWRSKRGRLPPGSRVCRAGGKYAAVNWW
jgi:hypothetical protein